MTNAGPAQSFAGFVLDRLDWLAGRLAEPEVMEWLNGQESAEIDGRRMWLTGGDRWVDENEMKLDYARHNGWIDEATIAQLYDRYPLPGPEVEGAQIDKEKGANE